MFRFWDEGKETFGSFLTYIYSVEKLQVLSIIKTRQERLTFTYLVENEINWNKSTQV
jgi:hypothetical protein